MQVIKWIGDNILPTLKKRSPEILTGIGIGGMITTTVLAVKATPEATRRIEERKRAEHHKKLTVAQTIQTTWKCYIPAGVTGIASITCLIGASAVNYRRNAALATMASIAESSLREYRSKVVETIGEKKETAILDAIDKDRVQNNPPPANLEAPLAEGANQPVLCYDSLFGRYFYSDVETIKRAVNKLHFQMNNMSEPYVSLNDFYMEIGLSSVEIGDDLGWRGDWSLIELRFSSQLVNGHTPCLVMTHLNPPAYGYSNGN